MTAQKTDATGDLTCLHCSPQRTVWRRTLPGADEVHKVYQAGAATAAEHELTMGELAAGPGVVEYLGAGTESSSGRPALRIAYLRGEDLEATVADGGAVPAARALTLVGSAAETLSRLHAIRTPTAPHGVVHGDVKPQNLLVEDRHPGRVVLLDFEHARAIGATHRAETFSGGTAAWAPPEAHCGAAPDASFDVFGLGATLAFLLDGGISRVVPRRRDVDALVQACCDPDARRRPSAADVAARCAALAAAVGEDAAERDLHDWTTGACSARPTDEDDPRSVIWPRRARLLQRLPRLLERPDELPTTPAALLARMEQVARTLRRFPRNAAALAWRRDLLGATCGLLGSAAEHTHRLQKREHTAEALRWLRDLEALVSAACATPSGPVRVAAVAPGTEPGALHRAPIEFLERLRKRIEADADALAERVERIEAAERDLDLTLAERRLDALADDYGGTSPTVAERRELQHRLSFYLERVARAESNVVRVGELTPSEPLRTIQGLVDAARAALEARGERDLGSGTVGLRSMQVTFSNLQEEFPHIDRVGPALAALRAALVALTEEAWQQLQRSAKRLEVVPVPVRPLQLALGRLDTLRLLEAFVDLPGRPRGELLDELERLRLGLEHARAARDRLAEDAEQALARGHWTTGLFEMERAVEGLNPGDEHERAEADRLKERLQAARRTKQELESAVRRNTELAAEHAALEDDADSTTDARLRALRERRDCLLFLGMHVHSERGELYRMDLRQVETLIAVEQASDAELRLAGLTDPQERLQLARSTLDLLGVDETTAAGAGQPGRLLRLQQQWRATASQCQRAVDEVRAATLQRRRERRRMVAVMVLLLLATSVAVGFAVKPWLFGGDVLASGR